MELNEIFKGIAEHQLKGVMLHSDMISYFDFLNLHGYKRMEQYHAKKEMRGFRKLNHYYISRYSKLIPVGQITAQKVIPDGWYQASKQNVDINTKRTAVKNAFENWVKWEKETKTLYQQMYKELVALGDIDASLEIGKYIKDVSEELEWVESKKINLGSVDYAIDCIVDEQKYYHDLYKDK